MDIVAETIGVTGVDTRHKLSSGAVIDCKSEYIFSSST